MIDTEALRKKVIDLAIQGKLTEQLPSDGDAETLYGKIQKEKKKIIDSGVLKNRKKGEVLGVDSSDAPFEIPKNWKWIRLGNVSEIFARIGFRGYTKNDIVSPRTGAITISPSNILSNGRTTFEDCTYLSWEKYYESPEIMIDNDDLLVVKTGSSYGKSGIVKNLPEKATINPQIAVLKYVLCNPEYINYMLNSSFSRTQFEEFVVGAAIPTFSQEKLSSLLMPLPPLAEQKRIVEKLQSVMSEIDIIDDLQAKYRNDLAVLKNKIIDAGIRGKLAEQLPEDGDAETLYSQIQEEKDKLIKEGKIKKEKPLPEIEAGEIPFEIPKNWKWVRFGDLMWNRDSERIPVSVADRKKLAKIYDYYGASGAIDKVEEYLFDEKLLLVSEDGANLLSRSTPIAFLAEGKYWVNNHAHVLGYYKYDYLDFVMHYINSISLVPYVTGAAQPKLNQENMNKILVPLPPFSEQKRITEKIEELISVIE